MKRNNGLVDDVRLLARAAELSQGRAADEVVEQAQRVSTKVDRRLAFSGDATIVALAGATGSGKSSTFNAVSQTTFARADVRRPTTSKAMAGVWAPELSQSYTDILNWLDVPERNLVPLADPALAGLVLLDLPDHDSTQVAHRMEVDRLVQLVDIFIWVVDPQKYADAALHDHYLRPLAQHADVMIVALNQSDRVPDDERTRIMKDLRGLLNSEGLEKAELVAISAKTGFGIAELRQHLAHVVQAKTAAAQRLAGDVATAAEALQTETGTGPIPQLRKATVEELTATIALASGEKTVTKAVKEAAIRRGAIATGWPFVSWMRRLRPDPLKRLHLDVVTRGKKAVPSPVADQRTSLPGIGGVARTAVDSGIRALEDEASAGLPRGWAQAVREAAREQSTLLPDDLDSSIARTDLRMGEGTGWQWIFRIVQWILMLAVIVSGGWLLADLVLAYLQFPKLPSLSWHRLPLPTWLLIGGVGSGIVLSWVAKIFVWMDASRKARSAQRALRAAISEVTLSKVVEPVRAELARYAAVRESLDSM
ncbi:MAG: GTP-binding protein [Propionibacteriaceae bacterium]